MKIHSPQLIYCYGYIDFQLLRRNNSTVTQSKTSISIHTERHSIIAEVSHIIMAKENPKDRSPCNYNKTGQGYSASAEFYCYSRLPRRLFLNTQEVFLQLASVNKKESPLIKSDYANACNDIGNKKKRAVVLDDFVYYQVPRSSGTSPRVVYIRGLEIRAVVIRKANKIIRFLNEVDFVSVRGHSEVR